MFLVFNCYHHRFEVLKPVDMFSKPNLNLHKTYIHHFQAITKLYDNLLQKHKDETTLYDVSWWSFCPHET